MIEAIAMLTVLTGMGVYFVKSADLPQDLKDRSAQIRNEVQNIPAKNKFAHLNNLEKKVEVKTQIVINTEIQKAQKLELINKEIDQLTLIITTLEQEIKANNERNAEIQKEINSHLARLEELKAATLA